MLVDIDVISLAVMEGDAGLNFARRDVNYCMRVGSPIFGRSGVG